MFMISVFASGYFVLFCRCWRGAAKSQVFSLLVCLLAIRFVVGACLSERRSKMIPYLVLPFVFAFVTDQLAIQIMGH